MVIGVLVPQDVYRQMYTAADDHNVFQGVQAHLKAIKDQQEEGRAVLHHLEAQLINVACNDPGAIIAEYLVLPLIQERLDRKAAESAPSHSGHQAGKDLATQVRLLASGVDAVCSLQIVSLVLYHQHCQRLAMYKPQIIALSVGQLTGF